jgi:gamma-glutamyltranspeptidase/glutathione hydrolase
VVEPARRAAEKGFRVEKHLASMLASGQKNLSKDAGLSGIFYPGGKPAAFGRVLKNPALAKTLGRIAAEGPNAFYEGEIAARLVEAARAKGGSLSMADLRAYKPVERKPISVEFDGRTVYTMPAPSAGGMMLAQTLRLFTPTELRKLGYQSAAYQHLIAEALRAAVADRMRHLGDPAFEKFDLERLIAQERMDARRKRIALDRTHAIPRFGLEEHGTHHITTLDREGNMVALTTTVNRLFGAKYSSRDGIVLNDELDDFTERKGVAPFDMQQSPNRPRAGARPVSSMTPTIVVDRKKQVVLGLGGSGGTAIGTNVTQLLLAHLVFGRTPAQAVSDRRFYIPTERAFILLEKGAPAELVDDLERRGEIVGELPYNGTAVQMISVDERGRAFAAADPRKHGVGLVY